MDMAEYLLHVASMDDRRLEYTKGWLDLTSKACDLRDARLKECLSEVLIAQAAERKSRALQDFHTEARVPSASMRINPCHGVGLTIANHGQSGVLCASKECSMQQPPTNSLPALAVGATAKNLGPSGVPGGPLGAELPCGLEQLPRRTWPHGLAG